MTKKDIVIEPNAPQKIAEQFKALRFPTLLSFQNEWLSHDGAAYQPMEDQTITTKLSQFLKAAKVRVYLKDRVELVDFTPTPKVISDVYTMLKNDCHVPLNTMSPPSWLEGTPASLAAIDPKNIISCQNGLLDIDTRKLYPATPKFFTRTALPIAYDKNAPEPTLWLGFLDEVTAGRNDDGEIVARPAMVALIREMMGYLISSDTSMQRVFFLWGQPRSGKGTIMRVTTALVGKLNTGSPNIQGLAGEFGRENLIGKSLATITDMDCDSKGDLSRAASIINGVSGEDFQSINRKNRSFWNGFLPSRFMLASNSLPNFGSHTAAMATRLLIMPFENSFVGRIDPRLTDKLETELAGILNWCLDGLDDLQLRGDFDEPAESIKHKERLVLRSNPIHGFVAERCTVETGADISKDLLYDRYTEYCEETKSRVLPKSEFIQGLTELYPAIFASKHRVTGTTRQIPCYRGVRLNDELAATTYRLDADLIDIGFEAHEALAIDAATGWPILRGHGEAERGTLQ
jgi:putative DNA primase/helicase